MRGKADVATRCRTEAETGQEQRRCGEVSLEGLPAGPRRAGLGEKLRAGAEGRSAKSMEAAVRLGSHWSGGEGRLKACKAVRTHG